MPTASAMVWPEPTFEPFGQTLLLAAWLASLTEQRLLLAQLFPFQLRPLGRVIFSEVDVAGWPLPSLVACSMPRFSLTAFGFFLVPALPGLAENDRSIVVFETDWAYATPAIERANTPISASPRVFFSTDPPS